MKRPLLLMLMLVLTFTPTFSALTASAEESETLIIPVDSVNGTRWEDTMCVYKDRASTDQNQWGYNVVVSSDGIVVNKVEKGSALGTNLAVPAGGFVISAVGDLGQNMFDSINLGDHAIFDEYASRVMVSANAIDPFYTVTHKFTSYNQPRYANTLIIYNKGKTTETNTWGHEVVVDKDGIVVSAGGNNNAIPDGGFVISAIEAADKSFLKTYCVVGSKITISGNSFTVDYNAEMLANTVKAEIELVREKAGKVLEEKRLVDTEKVIKELENVKCGGISTLEERNALINEVKKIGTELIEKRSVGIRSVWYVPTERNAKDVEKTVAEMKKAGINQLCLGTTEGAGTIVQMPDTLPFKTKAVLRSIDLLAIFVDECHKNGIEIVLSVPVFSCHETDGKHASWMAAPSKQTDNAEAFWSPANDEYIAYFKDYAKHIITHYDIDGFQYDYIRYPYFDGNVDYGYDDATKELFLKETGLGEDAFNDIKTKLTSSSYWSKWTRFKCDLITRRVGEITALINEIRPDLYVTACLAHETKLDSYFQDGKTWVEKGYVDGIYPMSYGAGIMEQAPQKFTSYNTDKSFTVMGNGAYQSLSIDEMVLQTEQTREFLADGIAYFEWTAYKKHGYADYLVSTVNSDECISFTYDESGAIKELLAAAKERFARYAEKDVSSLFASPSEPAALKAELEKIVPYDKDLYYDIDLAVRINNFSREIYKDTFEFPSDGETSDEESADTETSEELSAAEKTSEESKSEKGSSFPTAAIVCAVIGIVAATAVFFVIKKRKKTQNI